MSNSTDLTALKGFSDALREYPEKAGAAAAEALNEAAWLAREKGVGLIESRTNLKRRYIEKHLTVREEARRTDLFARISATEREVLATRYGAKVATASAPGAAGDPYRGIPAGSKAAGSTDWSVLSGGNSKAWRNTFFVWLKTSGAFGMVARKGAATPGMSPKADWKQNLEVIHSMSVAQAWRGVRDEVSPAAMALAQERFLEAMAR